MQKQANAIDVRINIKMIDPRGVEGAGAANNSVHFVAFFQQQIGQVTSVLAGYAGDERLLHERRLALRQAMRVSKHFWIWRDGVASSLDFGTTRRSSLHSTRGVT